MSGKSGACCARGKSSLGPGFFFSGLGSSRLSEKEFLPCTLCVCAPNINKLSLSAHAIVLSCLLPFSGSLCCQAYRIASFSVFVFFRRALTTCCTWFRLMSLG